MIRKSSTSPHLILVVEDDDVVRGVLCRVVGYAGYDTAAAASGPAALTLLEAGFRPAAILLDVTMGGMDGFAFVERLRGLPALAALPIVAMTEHVTLGAEALARLQARASLRKPFTVEDLSLALRAAID
ncbi:MAG TPA: response regulator [Vicinamibacterales bacterium]|nr:response regulator [Vicinamibacterales bacterium]